MKSTTINIKDLLKNNPRVCLSAKRSVNKCYDCIHYEKCESRIINKKYEIKVKRIKLLTSKINKLQNEIKEL